MLELTILLPFYKRVEEFSSALQNNARFIRPNTEVLLVQDDPSDLKELLALVGAYPNIHWQIQSNSAEHAWRNPAKPLNVGIRKARAPIIFIASPETIWLTDVPNILWQRCVEQPNKHHYGEIVLASEGGIPSIESFKQASKLACGSLCVRKEHLERLHGYDESLQGWGADDDNLRRRLHKGEIYAAKHPEAMSVHHNGNGKHRFYSADTEQRLRELLNPQELAPNSENWGKDFDNLVYLT
jgi:hypothetical protein